jgi:hypothetical protein
MNIFILEPEVNTMARDLTENEAPDPARSYERSRPEDESGQGDLKAPKTRSSKQGDRMDHAVANRQGLRQLNAEDVVNAAGGDVPHGAHRGANKKTSAAGAAPVDAKPDTAPSPKTSKLRIDRKH